MTLKDFIEHHVYPGEQIEVAGVGPDEGKNPVRFSGSCDELPQELYNAVFRYVASTGDNYMLRIECDFAE